MSWVQRAVPELRSRLAPVEAHARGLPWHGPRGFSARTHVGTERRLWVRRDRDERIVRLDLHGLDRRGAEIACDLAKSMLLEAGSPLRYLRIVAGRGLRSVDGRRVLFAVVAERFVADDPLAVRSSTADAPVGFLDVWHRGRWPRLTEGRASTGFGTADV